MGFDLTFRPAFLAYKFASQEISDARFVREISEYGGVRGYELDRGDRRIWLIWAVDQETHTLDLPGTPLAIWDALGNPIATDGDEIQLGINPHYLEWDP
jgi:hypothetical protein